MKGESTYLQNPEEPDEEPKKFTFDYSYWSHDGFEERDDGYLAPSTPHYADQVLNDVNVIIFRQIMCGSTKVLKRRMALLSFKTLRGWWALKSQIFFKEGMKLNWNFQRCRVFNLLWRGRGVWIFIIIYY